LLASGELSAGRSSFTGFVILPLRSFFQKATFRFIFATIQAAPIAAPAAAGWVSSRFCFRFFEFHRRGTGCALSMTG
jgi:hypothetical protein